MSAKMSEPPSQSGLAQVRSVVDWIGCGGASLGAGMDPENPRGLSPLAVRQLVRHWTSEMVKLPATFATADLRRLGGVDGRQRVRCPIFTEAGKSRLALDFVVGWDGYGNPSVFPERVVDTATGLVLLTEDDAPARIAPHGQRVPGTGEDPRIRRDAQIGDANLVDQICGRIEQAHGDDIDMGQLSTGQQAVYALVQGYGEAHEHQLYTFVEDHPEWSSSADLHVSVLLHLERPRQRGPMGVAIGALGEG